MNIISFFIVLQIILLFFMTFHDWVHLPPLTDIRALEKNSSKLGRLINSSIFFIPLLLTIIYRDNFSYRVLRIILSFYGILSLGTIFSWWVPYIFGSSEKHKTDFAEYKDTHHFLPKRGDNVVPNTFHVILHVQIWTCFAIALFLYLSYK